MKLRSIISISVIAIFVMGLVITPAIADWTDDAAINSDTTWQITYDPSEESQRYVVTEEEKPGMFDGVFSAANWLVSGTLDMAGATYDGTEKLTKDVLTSSGNTVNAAVDTSGAIIDGSLEKSGEIVYGTMQFTDDTVKGTTGAVMGTVK
jgi:hypothetical protein